MRFFLQNTRDEPTVQFRIGVFQFSKVQYLFVIVGVCLGDCVLLTESSPDTVEYLFRRLKPLLLKGVKPFNHCFE